MSEQEFDNPEEVDNIASEEYDYAREPEPDVETLRSNERRSRYFLAVMSFLLALLCLSAYLNNLAWLNGTLLQLCVVLFVAIGVFFLVRGGRADRENLPKIDGNVQAQGKEAAHHDWLYESQSQAAEQEAELPQDGASEHDEHVELTPFELLVQEALASIPPEFQERMENVYVRVEYEPGTQVLRRVGTKEGYTLLGLYEGVPLTTYGRIHSAQPETITIYQHIIERYCHGDPDRIREQVQQTVLHEVAHHFGIDHDEMPIWIRGGY